MDRLLFTQELVLNLIVEDRVQAVELQVVETMAEMEVKLLIQRH